MRMVNATVTMYDVPLDFLSEVQLAMLHAAHEKVAEKMGQALDGEETTILCLGCKHAGSSIGASLYCTECSRASALSCENHFEADAPRQSDNGDD